MDSRSIGQDIAIGSKIVWLIVNYLLCFLSAFDINGFFKSSVLNLGVLLALKNILSLSLR